MNVEKRECDTVIKLSYPSYQIVNLLNEIVSIFPDVMVQSLYENHDDYYNIESSDGVKLPSLLSNYLTQDNVDQQLVLRVVDALTAIQFYYREKYWELLYEEDCERCFSQVELCLLLKYCPDIDDKDRIRVVNQFFDGDFDIEHYVNNDFDIFFEACKVIRDGSFFLYWLKKFIFEDECYYYENITTVPMREWCALTINLCGESAFEQVVTHYIEDSEKNSEEKSTYYSACGEELIQYYQELKIPLDDSC